MTRRYAVFHVQLEQRSGQWEIHWEGHSLASFPRKDDAVEDGLARASGPLPARLVIHRIDGEIENVDDYP